VPFARFIAKELARPSEILGRLFLAPMWNKRNSALNDLVFEQLALETHDRVIEIGFGGGYLLGRMAEVARDGFLAGVDASPGMVAFCRRRFRQAIMAGKLDLRCAGAELLPYPDQSFSKACSVNSIFYWSDPQKALTEIGRVLPPGGRLVLCMTCKESLAQKDFAKHGLRLFTEDEVKTLVFLSGFSEPQVLRARDRHREFLCLVASKQGHSK